MYNVIASRKKDSKVEAEDEGSSCSYSCSNSSDSGSENCDENDPETSSCSKIVRKRKTSLHLSDDEILAIKLAFVLSSADPQKNSKWRISSQYWQQRGLLGLDHNRFKKVCCVLCLFLMCLIFS